MKRLFTSFYFRLSALFLVLLLVMGAVYVTLSVESAIDFVHDADQRMNAGLARAIAVEIAPSVEEGINSEDIGHVLHYLMVINPHIEIYLLDSSGTVLAFFADPVKKVERESVSLEPIHQFLNAGEFASVQGDDPRNANRRKPFSAAPIELDGGRPGYIYVILGGEQYDLASAAIREQFLTTIISRGFVLSLLFTGILGLVLIFFMTKRLRRITTVVSDFKEGNLEQRLDDKSADEFGRLSVAFDQMADTIVRNLDDLKHSDDLRRELVANVSHDLRTPLATIQGYLETIQMKQNSLSPEEVGHYVEISLHNARYLDRLVSELFELSKLNAIKAGPVKEPFSLSELIQDVILKFRESAANKQIEIRSSLDQSLPLVSGDIGMIERVLSNLIDNAIQYVPSGAYIQIETIPSQRHVRVKITDSGPGIDAEDVPHIFLPYYRGKRKSQSESKGTGLGLAITKRILELHDSDIHVASEQDQGATFYFDLAVA